MASDNGKFPLQNDHIWASTHLGTNVRIHWRTQEQEKLSTATDRVEGRGRSFYGNPNNKFLPILCTFSGNQHAELHSFIYRCNTRFIWSNILGLCSTGIALSISNINPKSNFSVHFHFFSCISIWVFPNLCTCVEGGEGR